MTLPSKVFCVLYHAEMLFAIHIFCCLDRTQLLVFAKENSFVFLAILKHRCVFFNGAPMKIWRTAVSKIVNRKNKKGQFCIYPLSCIMFI